MSEPEVIIPAVVLDQVVRQQEEIESLRQQVKDEQEKNIQLKLAVLKAKAKLTAERDMSDKLEKALNDLLDDQDTWEQAVDTITELAALKEKMNEQ